MGALKTQNMKMQNVKMTPKKAKSGKESARRFCAYAFSRCLEESTSALKEVFGNERPFIAVSTTNRSTKSS